jgi:hypothetical protein
MQSPLIGNTPMKASAMSDVSILNKYFSLVPDRHCGECMVCCEYMPISTATLKKRAEVLCDHCIVNQGCSIYSTRPNVCRTWHCLWRRDAAMADELRPDKSRMIFSLVIYDETRSVFENAHITCIATKSKSDYEAPLVSATIARYIDEGVLPVWRSYGGGKTLAYPDAELADAITKPITTRFPHLAQQGKDWLERYESLLEPLQLKNARLESEFVKR